jgi:hypothetical protein
MPFRTLGLIVLFVSTASFAQGRKPAVEDFVGIEVDQAEVTPHGSEVLFNLEQDIKEIEAQKNRPALKQPQITESKGFGTTTLIGIGLILGLPMFLWLLMMNHLKKKATLESASNIEVLEKYRREREKKVDETIKKAS